MQRRQYPFGNRPTVGMHLSIAFCPKSQNNSGGSQGEKRHMGLLSIFSSKDIDEMAHSLVQELVKRYPPSLDKPGATKISVARITRILEDLYGRAARFREEKRLGLYKKARLSNTFKWALKEQGYSSAFIDMATEGLIVYMSRKVSSEMEPAKKQVSDKKRKK